MLFALTLQKARTDAETEKFAVVVDCAKATEEVARAIAATKEFLTIFMIYLACRSWMETVGAPTLFCSLM
ncbi:hypothetical protein [Limnobacter sp. P1]|uniref:hypothetical protein n=1 Tax=Limnobacter olei TaxID=3031298 RepID=UPI0023AFEB3A|nr:hypothetical protein [Limnobacter sp. P1]